jgi:hypothetical protein
LRIEARDVDVSFLTSILELAYVRLGEFPCHDSIKEKKKEKQ